jgi:ABC-type nitrate/sulfonate/bicarbonate transport system substrate-binding protein
LRVGFVPETDCAPLVVAYEFGLFREYGLEVDLQSQASWKHVHDRIVQGQLDAAHAPGILPLLINLGLTPERVESLTGLVLSLQGNAITISRELRRLGIGDAAALRELMWEDRNRKIYTFGITCPFSAQYFLFRDWLKTTPGPPCTEMRIECVPPEQLFPLLKLGYLDGFCAGEPWGSVAVQAGVGACLETSVALAPLHPEKVLMVRKDFAAKRADEHERLLAALLEACHLCEHAENRAVLCQLLAQPQYVNAPVECLEPALVGPFKLEGKRPGAVDGLHVFHRSRANEPSAAKACWLADRLFSALSSGPSKPVAGRAFRSDIFHRVQRRVPVEARGHTLAEPAIS